ncbi:MAG TPA: amino acid adenylation domain-containing protein, partial [Blastocatellia bacterium]|nr:amino acid adenylation domain-containing protein [Blastocatellia bacterium]
MTSSQKTNFSATKQALLEKLRQGKLVGPSESRVIPRREENALAPLSFAQQRLWVLEQLDPGNTTYNITGAVQLRGRLDVATFERALNEVIKRHAILRTTFQLVGAEPVQIIAPQYHLTLPIVDIGHLGEREREPELHRLAVGQARTPFDLARGPLLRACLIRSNEREHVLLFSMHHIISDGWSTGILVPEALTFYEAFLTGTRPALAELTIQYADFAAWQRESPDGEILNNHLSYWRRQLQGMPPILELPKDKPRPPVKSNRGATKFFKLPRSLSDGLKALSRTENTTLFMTLLAGFKTLLRRYSAKTDIVVGTPVAGRNHLQLEGLIGFFVNMLVLRTDLSEDPSFVELLGRVRRVALEGQAHQDLPFEKLVDALQPERSLSHTPLVQVVFVFQNTPRVALRLEDLTIKFKELESGVAKFDLTLEMADTEEGLAASLEYNTDIFCAPTVERMASHFQTLLEAIVTNPRQRISELPLLSSAERHRLLAEWDADALDDQPQTCIHELFEAQSERDPEATALVFEKERLSYGDLNRRANQLAHHLRSLGVGPEVLVGICVERSIDSIVGILGILKAGGAYLPLDPDYPPERLAFMIEDARTPVILTRQEFVGQLPAEGEAIIVRLDTDWARISAEGEENPASGVAPQNPAYVIYTSGSTGKPKGVLITHRNVTRLFNATESNYHFDSTDVWTFFHSYAFDFSVWEIWGALLYGGSLVIVPYLVSRSPEAFYDLLSSEQVTVLNQTPSAFRQLVQAERSLAEPKELTLRLIIFGGEALELESLRPWFDLHGDRRPQLVNMYGITETTVHVTYRPLSMADLSAAGSRIGRPIPDLRLYIMDERLNPTPVGVPGEIYVGGEGLARCYLNRPGLTAERFIPDPFSRQPGERLYKTGDLARYLDGGDVEYLGRLDFQVKIRGFRIELREIENTLAQFPCVREAVVLVREEQPGDKYLVAYVVFDRDAAPPVNELRSYLKARLPEYLIPSAFVIMDALPLTSNNKVDYKALPVPDRVRPELDGAFIAPRNLTEETLAGIWADVLNIEQVGIHDNFFDLGGDSIRSIQVCAKAQKMGLGVSTQQLFLRQTVCELAREIDAAQIAPPPSKKADVEAFALVREEDRLKLPGDVEDAYPLTLLQAGILFYTESDHRSAIYYNINTIHLKAPFDSQAMGAALRQLASAHPVLRTSFDMTGFSEPLQLVHEAVCVPLEVDDVRHLSTARQAEVIKAWVEAEKQRRFDLTHAPLLRFQIHRRSDETFQFSWTEHHAILDGWSVASMLTELFHTYYGLLTEDAGLITKPPTSTFRNFVAAERQAIASGECKRYWGEKLEGKTVTALPKWP